MFGLSTVVTIWIFAGLGVMVILFLMSGMARLYRKAGPHEALIVYGLGGTRVVQGRGTLVFPMVQICRRSGSLSIPKEILREEYDFRA